MSDDILALVAGLHRHALVRLSAANGSPIQGLSQGCRKLGRRVCPNWRRKLRNLEAAHGLVRHITHESVADFLKQLDNVLQNGTSDEAPVPGPPSLGPEQIEIDATVSVQEDNTEGCEAALATIMEEEEPSADVGNTEAKMQEVKHSLDTWRQAVHAAEQLEKKAAAVHDRFASFGASAAAADPGLRESILALEDDIASMWCRATNAEREVSGAIKFLDEAEPATAGLRDEIASLSTRVGMHKRESAPPPTTKTSRPMAHTPKKHRKKRKKR